MNKVDLYERLGTSASYFPVLTTLLVFVLALSLAPLLGGLEVGGLRIPKLPDRVAKWMKFAAPVGFVVLSAGFLKIWPDDQSRERHEMAKKIVSAMNKQALLENFPTRVTNHSGEFEAVKKSISETRKALQDLQVPYGDLGDPEGAEYVETMLTTLRAMVREFESIDLKEFQKMDNCGAPRVREMLERAELERVKFKRALAQFAERNRVSLPKQETSINDGPCRAPA